MDLVNHLELDWSQHILREKAGRGRSFNSRTDTSATVTVLMRPSIPLLKCIPIKWQIAPVFESAGFSLPTTQDSLLGPQPPPIRPPFPTTGQPEQGEPGSGRGFQSRAKALQPAAAGFYQCLTTLIIKYMIQWVCDTHFLPHFHISEISILLKIEK